jgi:mannose-6-phosphate isomerase-like protein (cupin superfamily)
MQYSKQQTEVLMTSQWHDKLPTESYVHPPAEPFLPSDYLFRFAQLESFYDAPGEFGYILEGEQYGFDSLSFIITETHPGGGPPLHTHECEEAHIPLEGQAIYVIGEQRFQAEAPYVVKIPANIPHTFVNTGNQPFRLICTFPDKRLWSLYHEIGPNPLLRD